MNVSTWQKNCLMQLSLISGFIVKRLYTLVKNVQTSFFQLLPAVVRQKKCMEIKCSPFISEIHFCQGAVSCWYLIGWCSHAITCRCLKSKQYKQFADVISLGQGTQQWVRVGTSDLLGELSSKGGHVLLVVKSRWSGNDGSEVVICFIWQLIPKTKG